MAPANRTVRPGVARNLRGCRANQAISKPLAGADALLERKTMQYDPPTGNRVGASSLWAGRVRPWSTLIGYRARRLTMKRELEYPHQRKDCK